MATKESITRDLQQMKEKGYGGASLVDAGSSSYDVAKKTAAGPVFMSAAWMELYKHAVKEADRLGIELSVNVQSGWNPGGPSITPEFALKKIVYAEMEVSGNKLIDIELPQPESKLMYQDIIVQAIPKPAKILPIKDAAISNWAKKSFNKPMGWSGIYPLYELREGFDSQVEVNIFKKEEIIDLTKNFDGKKLKWNAPGGDWIIIRYGWTCTGVKTSTTSDGWNGLSMDHLSPAAFELFSNTVVEPLINNAKSVGNSVKLLQTDSWEMGAVNWTQQFPEEFKRLRGYDIFQFLPVLTGRVVQSQDVTNRFLHDFRKTVGDCVGENHYQLFYNLAHKHGMGIHPESGGPHSAPVDALKVMAISDFPQGEFWAMSNTHRVSDAARLAVKQSACVAHTNGKRFVAAEGPTSIGPQWERSPKDLKGNIDRIFCSGVNRIVWHTFTSSPKEFGLPGNEYFAGTHLNPNVTWWQQSGDFIRYLNRCSYMLQQGLFVADVLYYYGDDVPNFVFLKEEFPELKFGYDWDKCSKDVIINRLSFKDGHLVLPDGMKYRILVLAPEKAIDLGVLQKIEQLVREGATIIAPRPKTATGLTGFPASDQKVEAIANRLWGDMNGTSVTEHNYGKGKVIWGKDINKILDGMKVVPDLTFTGTTAQTGVDYIHRTTKEAEIYFVTNRFGRKAFNDFEYRYLPTLPDRFERVECRFRVTGKVPQIWDPITGTITDIQIYREENGQTIISLQLEPEGSKFILFKKASSGPHVVRIQRNGQTIFPGNYQESGKYPVVEITKNGKAFNLNAFEPGQYVLSWSNGKKATVNARHGQQEIPVTGSWKLQFNPKWGPSAAFAINELKSWTDFDDTQVKYYSGQALYTKNFTLDSKDISGKNIILDLGNIQEMASVKINGHDLGVKWNAPYTLDVSAFVKAGINELKVEVTNLWVNRLIGDGKLPKEKRLTQTNIVKFDSDDADKYLRVSGLMGPVKLIVVEQVKL